jgi:hypothetical protein
MESTTKPAETEQKNVELAIAEYYARVPKIPDTIGVL